MAPEEPTDFSSDSDSDSDSEAIALASTLTSLNTSLSQLELDFIQPLLAQTLADTLASLPGELDKAKLQVGLGYVIHDLVWIYLKTKGINPENHPVVTELGRIKSYYGKIQNAENPEKRKFAVDKPAAARFIKNALLQQQSASSSSSSTPTAPTEIGMQTRFNILKHQEDALLGPDDESSDSDDTEEGDEGKKMMVDTKVAAHLGKGKGKGKAKGQTEGGSRASTPVIESVAGVQVVDAGALEKEVAGSSPAPSASGKAVGEGPRGGNKSKRIRIDPFSGYDSPASAAGSRAGSPASSVTSGGGRKSGKKGGRR